MHAFEGADADTINKEFVFPDAVIEDLVGTHFVLLICLPNSM
jgi:hypothetical protein